MKKFVWLLLALLLLTGCGANMQQTTLPQTTDPGAADSEQPPHIHEAGDVWYCNPEYHWLSCSCGREMEKAPHTMEHNDCTVCSLQKKVNPDGTVLLTCYDPYGNCTYAYLYSAQGELQEERVMKYTYDEQGQVLTEKVTVNGSLYAERTYAAKDGRRYLRREVVREKDAVTTSTYNEAGLVGEGSIVDGKGQLIDHMKNEYVVSPEGRVMRKTVYRQDLRSELWEYTVNAEGVYYMCQKTVYTREGNYTVHSYDPDGTCTDETSFDANGNLIAG